MALFRHFTQVFAVLLVLLWTAEGSLEENTERVTTVECTTRAVDEPFTIEVRQQGQTRRGTTGRWIYLIGDRG